MQVGIQNDGPVTITLDTASSVRKCMFNCSSSVLKLLRKKKVLQVVLPCVVIKWTVVFCLPAVSVVLGDYLLCSFVT